MSIEAGPADRARLFVRRSSRSSPWPSALRARGIDFGVPVWEEPDAVIAMHVEHLREGSGRGDRRWSDQNYPHLIAQLTRPLGGARARRRARSRSTWRLPRALMCKCAGSWRCSRCWPSRAPGGWRGRSWAGPAALAAAAWMATSLLALSFSQQGRPHAAAGGLFVLSIAASMRLTRRAALGDHLLAALAAGAALGVLQTGVFVLPSLALAFCLRPGARGRGRLLAWPALAHLAVLAGSVLALLSLPVRRGAGELVRRTGARRRAHHAGRALGGALRLPRRARVRRARALAVVLRPGAPGRGAPGGRDLGLGALAQGARGRGSPPDGSAPSSPWP